MNAVFLYLPDGTQTKWSMCSECGQVAAPGNLDISEKCCTCYDCGKPIPKDERVRYANDHGGNGYSLYHRACERMRHARIQAGQLEAAQVVTDYTGPVYCEGRHGSYGDGYFADVDELAEDLDTEPAHAAAVRYAFCCTEEPFPGVNCANILENLCEEMFEDAADQLEGVVAFGAACDAFNKANERLISFREDLTRKVAIPTSVPTSEPKESR